MVTPEALPSASSEVAMAQMAAQPATEPQGEAPRPTADGFPGATGSSWATKVAAALALLLIALTTLLWSGPAWGAATDVVVLQRGARLFDNHCAGCHANGGNVIRRTKTLRRQDLLREGVTSAADVARIASEGKGQMSGYAKVLGEGGADAVGAWVWKQAEQGWPRR